VLDSLDGSVARRNVIHIEPGDAFGFGLRALVCLDNVLLDAFLVCPGASNGNVLVPTP
jgi:hypothetical protein